MMLKLRHKETHAIVRAGDLLMRHGPNGEEIWKLDSWRAFEKDAVLYAVRYGRARQIKSVFSPAEFKLEVIREEA